MLVGPMVGPCREALRHAHNGETRESRGDRTKGTSGDAGDATRTPQLSVWSVVVSMRRGGGRGPTVLCPGRCSVGGLHAPCPGTMSETLWRCSASYSLQLLPECESSRWTGSIAMMEIVWRQAARVGRADTNVLSTALRSRRQVLHLLYLHAAESHASDTFTARATLPHAPTAEKLAPALK